MITESIQALASVGGLTATASLGLLFLGGSTIEVVNDHLDDRDHPTELAPPARHRMPTGLDTDTVTVQVADLVKQFGHTRYYGEPRTTTPSSARP